MHLCGEFGRGHVELVHLVPLATRCPSPSRRAGVRPHFAAVGYSCHRIHAVATIMALKHLPPRLSEMWQGPAADPPCGSLRR